MADTKGEEKTQDPQEEVAGDSSDKEDTVEQLNSKEAQDLPGKELTFNAAKFPWHDLEIKEGNTTIWSCEMSSFISKKPEIMLHKGNKDGPVAGASHHRFSRSFKCGVGPDDISMKWTEMKRSGVLKGSPQFKFEWDGKYYILKRAKNEDHGQNGFSRLLLSHFKIVEEASGNTVALYINAGELDRKKGSLKIASGSSQDLEILCILGVASWLDRARRRRGGASGAGGP